MDHNQDGALEQSELEVLLVKMGTAQDEARAEAKQMMAEVDSDHDGLISFDEFASIWQRKLLSVNDKYTDCVFQILDSDGDGKISLEEIMEVFDGTTAESKALLKEVDQNRDGKIDLREFRAAMREEIESGRMKLGRNKVTERIAPEDQIDVEIEKKESDDSPPPPTDCTGGSCTIS